MSRINKEYRARSYNTLNAVFSVYGQICGHRILGLFLKDKNFNTAQIEKA